jgi:4-hydroxy-tetrahydrodipicolinate synthase
MTNIYQNLITALITPFENNQIDFTSLEKLINYQIENEVKALIVCGSTGESVTLDLPEIIAIAQYAKKIAKNNIKIIGGISSASTELACILAQQYQKIGLDGIMCVTPFYNKPTQKGLLKHFKLLSESSDLPIMLYSVPSRTGVDFKDETILELSEFRNIIALKDAGSDLERPLRLRRYIKNDFSLLSGDDSTCLAFNAQGGNGLVSVASNIIPSLCKQVQDLSLSGNFLDAFQIQKKLVNLYIALFIESNPIPIKYAASLLGLCKNELRLPMISLEDINKDLVKSAMTELSIL